MHTAVDDHSRLAYSEILTDEKTATAAAFWQRALAFFAEHGITVERVLTDNGSCYRSHRLARPLAEPASRTSAPAPTGPQTNGKVERFNRTLLDEWAYADVFRPTRPAATPSPAGSTATTTTAPTRQSAHHPPAASTTSPDTTASAVRAGAPPRRR